MANDFTWRKINCEERKEIEIQAKKIMENFSLKLEKINLDKEKSFIEKEVCFREEGESRACFLDKNIFLENAPNVSQNSIVAEKGDWVKK